jgi:hypothetical protein
MKSFIAVACFLAVASASPSSYYYNSQYPQWGQQAAAPAQRWGQAAAAPVQGWGQPASAPLVKAPAAVAPAASSNFDLGAASAFDMSKLLSPLTSLLGLLPQLMELLPENPGASLAKASATLDELSAQLPTALANIDPETKSDFAKVNVIIAEVCNKMLEIASPSEFSYYTPAGITAACEMITKTANVVTRGLDDPAVFQGYSNKLREFTKKLQAFQGAFPSVF